MPIPIGLRGHSNQLLLVLGARQLSKAASPVVARPVVYVPRRRRSLDVSLALVRCPTASGIEYHVRPAQGHEFWPVADVHCEAFYPHESPLLAPLLRLDRVISMISGEDFDASKRGKYVCLVAVARDSSGSPSRNGRETGSLFIGVLRSVLPERVRSGLGVPHGNKGVLGAVVMDTLGQFVPKLRVESGGRVWYEAPQGVAYISNLAVSPTTRRQGVGKVLMKAAEDAARDWGCKITALHCDPNNEDASRLYKGLGYTCPSQVDGCEEFVGRGKKGLCQLLVKSVG